MQSSVYKRHDSAAKVSQTECYQMKKQVQHLENELAVLRMELQQEQKKRLHYQNQAMAAKEQKKSLIKIDKGLSYAK